MDERKATIASNLIRLRLAAGMTQAELGEKLNYSDKSISKWERGDVTTDVFVLMQIADIFGVDLYEAGLAKTVEDDFRAMLAGPGAVRDILCRQLSERVRSDQP